MAVTVSAVTPDSPASRVRIAAGDRLLSINGREIQDVLDYRFFIPDTRLKITVESGGRRRTVRVRKAEYEEIGLEFDSYLMDEQHRCRNQCIFCFIDQLPSGMRESLYFKDDDSRLSFLFGNYITLTNLTEHEISRIIEMHISPINISVHTTNPELRCRMMNNRFAGRCLDILRRFADAGLAMHCQLVLVPEYNDGAELDRTLRDLTALGDAVRSVAAVPVGLTKYRDNLPRLRPFTAVEARQVIRQLTEVGDRMLSSTGSRVFYPADEWYILAGEPIPPASFYEDYLQLENGVGMIALLRDQFLQALASEEHRPSDKRFLLATGMAAAPCLRELVGCVKEKWPSLQADVVAIRNEFFGEQITVSGLITGGDLIRQLRGRKADVLLLPRNMLRQEEDCFLDDVTVSQVETALELSVRLIGETDGAALVAAFTEEA